MHIQHLMTKHLVTCHPDDSIQRAAQLMWDHDIGCVLVVDGEGRLVGLLTDRDALMGAYTQGLPLDRVRVSSVMAHEIWSCTPHSDFRDVEAIMRRHQVRRVPVVDPMGLPVGIVTLNDLARAARPTPHAPINQREVEHTLASISMPRHTA
jgi:CBS domain-containing protein